MNGWNIQPKILLRSESVKIKLTKNYPKLHERIGISKELTQHTDDWVEYQKDLLNITGF